MRTDREKEDLIKAMDALQRELIVVSPAFRILANQYSLDRHGSDMIGQSCHDVFSPAASPARIAPLTEMRFANIRRL